MITSVGARSKAMQRLSPTDIPRYRAVRHQARQRRSYAALRARRYFEQCRIGVAHRAGQTDEASRWVNITCAAPCIRRSEPNFVLDGKVSPYIAFHHFIPTSDKTICPRFKTANRSAKSRASSKYYPTNKIVLSPQLSKSPCQNRIII